MSVGYQVIDVDELRRIPLEQRFDGMMRFLRSPHLKERQWFSFVAASTAADDGSRVLMPFDTPYDSDQEQSGAGRWHQVQADVGIPVFGNAQALTVTDPDDYQTGSLAYLAEPQNSRNPPFALYRCVVGAAIAALSDAVIAHQTRTWLKVSPLVVTSSSHPRTYRDGTPPIEGLVWNYIAQFNTYYPRTVSFLAVNGQWVPLTQQTIGSTAPTALTPDFIGQQFYVPYTGEVWIAAGPAIEDWQLLATATRPPQE